MSRLFRKGILGICYAPHYYTTEKAYVIILYGDFNEQSSKVQAGSLLNLAALEIQAS